MARILGMVDFGSDHQPKYFIHCDTAGTSYRPLFEQADDAWRTYDLDGLDGLNKAVPMQSKIVKVIRKTLAYGRAFASNNETYGEPCFGLASEDRLLSPTSSSGRWYSLVEYDGELHVTEEVYGGMDGDYEEPVCVENRLPKKTDQNFGLFEFFNKPLNLCPLCVDKITGM